MCMPLDEYMNHNNIFHWKWSYLKCISISQQNTYLTYKNEKLLKGYSNIQYKSLYIIN